MKSKKNRWILQAMHGLQLLGVFCAALFLNGCQQATYSVNQLEIPQFTQSVTSQEIQHEAYTVSYNSEWLLPNWVAYELTAQEVEGEFPRADHFYPDPMVVGKQADNSDYRKSGYDRGHMAPAADMKWSETAMRESFYFTNICPQLHNLNAGVWQDFEDRGRKWANQYGSVYIVCGPVVNKKTLGTIGENQVVVPDGFYKVFLIKNNGRYEALGLLFDHVSGRKKMKNYACSVDSVEKITGIDFFYNLPDDVESRVEAQVNLSVWGLK